MNYRFIILELILLIGIITIIIPTQGNSVNSNLVSRWEIQEWNDAAAVFWWDPPITTTYFVATTGSYINYTLDYYDSENFTHPSTGIIEIGNLTTQTTNNKTGETLALSIWGWFPGLITSSNDWNYQKQVAQDAAQSISGDLVINDLKYKFNDSSRNAVNFTYSQSPGGANQNTSLVYDKDSGVLLEGFTELDFGTLYILKLKLIYSELVSDDNLISYPLISVFLGLTVISVTLLLSKKYRS